jgi:hypothetical protein
MTNIMPEGESLRKAVKWISEKRKENPEIDISRMVNEAGMRFDLSPKDQEFLFRFCKEGNRQELS